MASDPEGLTPSLQARESRMRRMPALRICRAVYRGRAAVLRARRFTCGSRTNGTRLDAAQ